MGPNISRAALEVLDRIFDRARHTRREVSDATVVEAVRGLEALREPGVIRYLARLVQRPGGSPSPIDSALARALSTLVFVTRPAHLPRLDVEFRRSRGLSVGEELEALASKSDPAFLSGLLALASMDADGFVRERALRRLAESDDSRVLPFLFLRLDDWVEPVRRVAMTAIQARMKLSAARDFMRCLGILPQLDLKRRVRETKLIDWVREWLLQPELAGHLALGLAAPELAEHIVREALDSGAGAAILFRASEQPQWGQQELWPADNMPASTANHGEDIQTPPHRSTPPERSRSPGRARSAGKERVGLRHRRRERDPRNGGRGRRHHRRAPRARSRRRRGHSAGAGPARRQ